MARYKVLKSVVHSIGHSYSSLMNYEDGDYIMGHLLSRCAEVDASVLRIDLIHGHAEPQVLLTKLIAGNIKRYCERFVTLVEDHRTDMKYIQSAEMAVSFDLSRRVSIDDEIRGSFKAPYSCVVTIVDDRGKKYEANFSGWWYPELISRKRWWQFWKRAT